MAENNQFALLRLEVNIYLEMSLDLLINKCLAGDNHSKLILFSRAGHHHVSGPIHLSAHKAVEPNADDPTSVFFFFEKSWLV